MIPAFFLKGIFLIIKKKIYSTFKEDIMTTQEIENQRDLEELVELSRNTLALLAHKKETDSPNASDDEGGDDDDAQREESSQLRQSIFRVLGDGQSTQR